LIRTGKLLSFNDFVNTNETLREFAFPVKTAYTLYMESTDTPEKDKPIQWHPAFFQAIKLELDEYRHALKFIYEYQLTSGPQRIDVVIIKKTADIQIRKNIAAIFRKENLLEYKRPDESVSVKDFYKVYGYACQYIQLEENKDIAISDLTLTFVGSHYPQELIKHLTEQRNFTVEESYPGIYTVKGDIMPIQLIDSRRLSAEENLWLKELDNRLNPLRIRKLTEEIWRLGNYTHIAAYIDAIMKANSKSVEEMYEMSESALTLDEVLVKVGATARWEAKAEAKTKEKVARNALQMNMLTSDIVKLTGLTHEEVENLRG